MQGRVFRGLEALLLRPITRSVLSQYFPAGPVGHINDSRRFGWSGVIRASARMMKSIHARKALSPLSPETFPLRRPALVMYFHAVGKCVSLVQRRK